jgi:hypothetical protein
MEICDKVVMDVLVHSRRRFLSGETGPFPEFPPSVNGLVHSQSVPHLCEWTGSFAECTHFANALHAYMRTHVCTLGWPYLVEFN